MTRTSIGIQILSIEEFMLEKKTFQEPKLLNLKQFIVERKIHQYN
jgi:hypothetical protein